MFHKNGSQWELAGITLANYIYTNQETIQFNQASLYGNASTFADLATYNSAITTILAAHPDYSVVGDLNLDGVVDQNDLNTFVANWGYNSGTSLGSMTTWKKGDLFEPRWQSRCQRLLPLEKRGTVVHNFVGILASMLGISEGNLVPEPATITLLLATALGWLGTRRRPTSLC